MPSQRIILGIGLAILLVIGAASIGLDIKSRPDTASVDHALAVLGRISDMWPLLHRAESTARSFALTGDQEFATEYHHTSGAILPALDSLIENVHDSPGERRLIERRRHWWSARLPSMANSIRLRNAGDDAGIAALVSREDRAATATIAGNLEKAVAEARRLLAARRAEFEASGRILLAIDLAGVALILILATALTLSSRRSRRELQASLTATKATNEALQAAVTERTEHLVAAHAELRHSAAVLQSTFHSMAEAVLVLDPKGDILLANPAAEKMLRYRQGMNVGQLGKLSVAYHADGVTRLEAKDMPSAQVLRGGTFDEQEIFIRPADDRAPLHLVVSGRSLRDASGAITGAALVYHDITAWRETEHKLLQSQKLEAIGKLTGGVAHDFNNLLTVIIGTTEMLVASLKHQPGLRKTAELIDQAAERCSELTQHLLAFARRQPLRPRNVDINAPCSIRRLLRPTLGEQIEVNSILQQEVATAHIDASQLANAVLNLAINARDAMPNGGKLTIETRNVDARRSLRAGQSPTSRPATM